MVVHSGIKSGFLWLHAQLKKPYPNNFVDQKSLTSATMTALVPHLHFTAASLCFIIALSSSGVAASGREARTADGPHDVTWRMVVGLRATALYTLVLYNICNILASRLLNTIAITERKNIL